MKRITLIAMFAAAFAVTGCKKKDEGNKPAATDVNKPAAGTATPTPTPAPGTATPTPTTPTPTTPTDPAAPGGTAAMPADPAAPGGTAAAPSGATPTDAEFEALMNKTIGMVTAMADAADKAGGDCSKLADSLDKVMADHKDFIEEAKKWKGNPAMDAKAEAWMSKNTDKMMGPAMKLAGASQKCMGDAKFKATMERFEAIGG